MIILAIHPVLYAVILVSVIGVLAGFGLAVASYFLAVEENPLAAELTEVLPGANCGACGYSGCAGYAAALAEGKEGNTALCAPGGAKTAKQVAACLGQESGNVEVPCAQVLCQGHCGNTGASFEYQGLSSCAAATLVSRGPGSCSYGCIGLGDCVKACPFDSISIVDNLAVIHSDTCKGCRKCIPACPQHLISMFPRDKRKSAVYCHNEDKGAMARKACKTACIACSACVRACPKKCISILNNRAVIDTKECVGCMKCVHACPTKAILPQRLPVAAEEA